MASAPQTQRAAVPGNAEGLPAPATRPPLSIHRAIGE